MKSDENSNDGAGHDLEFSTTVDGSIQQNVPIPPPQTNSVLSNMIAQSSSSSLSLTNTNNNSGVGNPQSLSSSYTPSSLQFSQSSHPTACLFHVLFKGLALTLYTLGSKMMMMEDVMVTVLCILLLAADFWVVKNITGRLLVGLRWWNNVDPVTGSTHWIFESADPTTATTNKQTTNNKQQSYQSRANNNKFDYRFFWAILYMTPILWGFLSLSAILWLQFQCFVTVTVALVLSLSNVYGYYKCSTDQREKWNEWMNAGAQMGVGAMIRNGMFGRFLNVFGGGGGGRRQSVPQQDPNVMPGTFA